MNGKFVISLDFELNWGVRDIIKFEHYKNHLLGVREVIPRLLEVFQSYHIHATFATVGLLFFDTKKEVVLYFPAEKPSYQNHDFSPYLNFSKEVGENEDDDPYHFGRDLIHKIQAASQEIGSHSFCHYYCWEAGQTIEEFRADIKAAIDTARANGIALKSYVFPRNQFNKDYLEVVADAGFTCYRGNQNEFMYNYQLSKIYSPLQRLLRMMDSYINLTGSNSFYLCGIDGAGLLNIPSSRLLRPYNARLSFLENRRLKRITQSMTEAAQQNKIYHLWWHPHNFGVNINENIQFLEQILSHYSQLNKQYGFESVSMGNLSEQVRNMESN